MRLGVDEAGKGPVLGSMFAAAVRADPADLPDGVGDSKDIAPARRETLDSEIRDVADSVGVAEIPVARIDDPGTDMNSLTVAAHVEALAAVAGRNDAAANGADEAHLCLCDAGDTNADRFAHRVADGVETACDGAVSFEVEARHGADAADPVVGAASILAKVARDAHVERLGDEYGEYGESGTLGSGYPSDPTTRAFLRSYVEANGDIPPCARSSWQTCTDLLAARDQAALGDF